MLSTTMIMREGYKLSNGMHIIGLKRSLLMPSHQHLTYKGTIFTLVTLVQNLYHF